MGGIAAQVKLFGSTANTRLIKTGAFDQYTGAGTFNFRVESKGVVYIFTLDKLGNVFTDNESGIPKAIPDRFGNVTVFNDGDYIVFNVRRNLDIVTFERKKSPPPFRG